MITSNLEIGADDVAAHYDDLDRYYRSIWGDHLHHGLWLSGRESLQVAMEQLIDCVADALELGANVPSHVCDVGCGYGATSRYLADKRDWQMTGLTISQQQHAYAQRKTDGSPYPRFLLRNWEDNGLKSSAYDGLLSIECVSHVVDKARFFAEVFRILKPGRRAAVIAWLSAEDTGRIANDLLLKPICRGGRLPSMGTTTDYKQFATASGLRVVRYDDLSLQVRKTWRICVRRVVTTLLFSRLGWKFVLGAKSRHSVFVFTVARILAAYYCGAMNYGLFVLEKPE